MANIRISSTSKLVKVQEVKEVECLEYFEIVKRIENEHLRRLEVNTFLTEKYEIRTLHRISIFDAKISSPRARLLN